MTREEAIKLLTQYIDYDAETPDYYEMEKACKVALKALEQEPRDDAISRDAVLDLVADYDLSMGQVVKGIHNLPSVYPKPILDKIRAEILENSIEDYKYHGCGTDELIIETSEVLRILDKYKAESEDKE